MRSPSLRMRLIAAFLLVSAVATLASVVLTGWGWRRSFDRYLSQRTDLATRGAVMLARETYVQAGSRWTPAGLDRLAHEFALTGYDVRLRSGSRQLIDTTVPKRPGTAITRLRTVAVVDARGTSVAQLEVYGIAGKALTPVEAELRRELDRGHIIAATIAGGLALLFGIVVAGRLARPLRRLADGARALGAGESAGGNTLGGPPEVRAIGDALAALSDSLARQDSARRQLAEDLAHELRTPLTLIQSRVEAMQDGVVPLDAEGLEVVHTELLRLTRLIDQIEQLANAEAHPVPPHPAPTSLAVLASDLHSSLLGAFEARGIRFQLDARTAVADADRDTTVQIVANLLSNALKYTPEAGTVTIATDADASNARLSVTDSGSPIPDEEAARIFERFYRGSGARRTGGAGLGLSIARDLATAQGGSLVVEPRLAGNRFILSLPTAQVVAATVKGHVIPQG
ncbi:MAG: HAMP domain-containing histidine kinase [Actinobacteria bacterium]|nr:HAMP domain-containing histidine kinase [Actinomycetota bacterium]